jgi:hypothetical protein
MPTGEWAFLMAIKDGYTFKGDAVKIGYVVLDGRWYQVQTFIFI